MKEHTSIFQSIVRSPSADTLYLTNQVHEPRINAMGGNSMPEPGQPENQEPKQRRLRPSLKPIFGGGR